MCKKISVIIPCYNVESYIDRCLTSVINQTIGLDALYIICVNDASTDQTLPILRKWEARYPDHILIIDCKENARQGHARNIALPYVQTPYVTYVDSDDWISSDMYEKMYQKAIRYDCDIVHCQTQKDNSDMSDSFAVPTPIGRSWLLSVQTAEDRKSFIVNNSIKYSCCDKLIQTDLLRNHDIFFPEHLAYEDIFWGSLLYLYAKNICIMEEAFYHYCLNNTSTVRSLNQPHHKDVFAIHDLKWEAWQSRNAFELYQKELEFDYLITGYLGILKTLVFRFTTDTWPDYLHLYETVRQRIPHYASNPYLDQLSELQLLQIRLLNQKMSAQEWHDFCALMKSISASHQIHNSNTLPES